MAKAELTTVVTPKCQRLADEMGYELVDVCLDKENTGKFLRIYVDRPEGMSLDDCERYHRAIMPLVESYDFDFLEVSSPGIDRPLKKDRDFERALGHPTKMELRFDNNNEIYVELCDTIYAILSRKEMIPEVPVDSTPAPKKIVHEYRSQYRSRLRRGVSMR